MTVSLVLVVSKPVKDVEPIQEPSTSAALSICLIRRLDLFSCRHGRLPVFVTEPIKDVKHVEEAQQTATVFSFFSDTKFAVPLEELPNLRIDVMYGSSTQDRRLALGRGSAVLTGGQGFPRFEFSPCNGQGWTQFEVRGYCKRVLSNDPKGVRRNLAEPKNVLDSFATSQREQACKDKRDGEFRVHWRF